MMDYGFDPGISQTTWSMTADTQLCGQPYAIAKEDIIITNVTGYRKACVRNDGS